MWQRGLYNWPLFKVQARKLNTLMQKPPTKRTANKLTKDPRSSLKKVGVGGARDPETDLKVPDTDGWLTRNETSDVLRCSMQTLKNYEIRGNLHPKHALRRDRTGAERVMVVYDPKELTNLPSKKPEGPGEYVRQAGEQAARAFEMFRDGNELDDVVIELRETPERVDQLHEHWREQTKARWVLNPKARDLLKQLVGEFKNVTDLVDALNCQVIKADEKLLLEGLLGQFNTVAEFVELLGNFVVGPSKRKLLEGALGQFATVSELVRHAIAPETRDVLTNVVGEFQTVAELVELLAPALNTP